MVVSTWYSAEEILIIQILSNSHFVLPRVSDYRSFRANFTYDVIPIALFQAQIYVTFASPV